MVRKNLEKILFVRPPETSLFLEDVSLSDESMRISPYRGKVPILSIYHLGSLVKKALRGEKISVEVNYFDFASTDPENMDNYLGGFSSNSSLNYGSGKIYKYLQGRSLNELTPHLKGADTLFLSSPFAAGAIGIAQTIHLSKKINPSLKVVVGGRDVQYRPEWYFKQGADILVIGQGEGVVEKIVSMIHNDEFFSGKGYLLSERRKDFGGDCFPKNMDLSELVLPDFQKNLIETYKDSCEGDIPSNLDGPAMWYTTSVGCINNCGFCPSAGNPYNEMSLENFSTLLNHYKKSGIKVLLSAEDNFLARLKSKGGEEKVINYLEIIRHHGLANEFANGLQVNLLLDEKENPKKDLIGELCKFENNSGTFRMYFPIETFESKRRVSYGKLSSMDKVYELIDSIVDSGMPEIVFNSILFQDTSEEDINVIRKEMSKFVNFMSKKDVKWSLPIFHELPLPGSKNYSKLEPFSYGIDIHPELYNVMSNPVHGKYFSAPELFKIKYKLMEEFDPECLKTWTEKGHYGINSRSE